MDDQKYEDNVKKILCCSSIVYDLTTAKAVANRKKLEKLMDSEQVKNYLAAADELAAVLK